MLRHLLTIVLISDHSTVDIPTDIVAIDHLRLIWTQFWQGIKLIKVKKQGIIVVDLV